MKRDKIDSQEKILNSELGILNCKSEERNKKLVVSWQLSVGKKKEGDTPPNPLLIEGEFLQKKEEISPPLKRGGRGCVVILLILS
jgi:hypothetical protein